MPVIGSGDVDGVDVVPRQQFAEVDVRRAVAVAIVSIHPALAVFSPFLADVADGGIVHIGSAQKSVLIA